MRLLMLPAIAGVLDWFRGHSGKRFAKTQAAAAYAARKACAEEARRVPGAPVDSGSSGGRISGLEPAPPAPLARLAPVRELQRARTQPSNTNNAPRQPGRQSRPPASARARKSWLPSFQALVLRVLLPPPGCLAHHLLPANRPCPKSPQCCACPCPPNINRAGRQAHQASSQSELGVGCKLCSSSNELRGLGARAQVRV